MKTMDFENKSDEELVRLSIRNQDYFIYLISRYEGKLAAYIRRISGFNYEDIEDLLQEIFIKIYYNLNSFDPKLKFSSWVYRIAHNETISEFRKRSVRPINYLAEEDLVRLAGVIDMTNNVDLELLNDDIDKVFKKMKNKYSEVLILKYLEDKDYKEISDILKKPVGTVGTLINRGKKKFKQEFTNFYGKSR